MVKVPSQSQLKKLIETLHNKYRNNCDGKLTDYIPELANVDPNKFGISITTIDGNTVSTGDFEEQFTIQSISKPLVFGLALEKHGLDLVRSRVNVEPTGEPFHSIIRLDNISKRPSNPLVNSGAIAMTNLIKGENAQDGLEYLKNAFEKYMNHEPVIDEAVYESEKLTGNRNKAIAYLMLNFDMIDNRVEETLDLYFRQCSFNVDSVDLANIGASLANNGVNPITGAQALDPRYIRSLLTLMFTCGQYTYAGEWAFDIGVPAKSGVSGGIMAAIPGRMGIGVYSPLVDKHGNSVRGLKVFRELSDSLELHTFRKTSS